MQINLIQRDSHEVLVVRVAQLPARGDHIGWRAPRDHKLYRVIDVLHVIQDDNADVAADVFIEEDLEARAHRRP